MSNLNRQFLFRESDVGKSKAECAAAFVERRVKGVKITPHNCKIQDKDESFYAQFAIVVSGLDSIEARRWINVMLYDLARDGDIKPMVDGGTEGFKGQSRVIIPSYSACYECQLDMHVPRQAVPLCTLATIPRQPQHCIEWAHIIAWEQHRKGEVLDTDDPEHIIWLYQHAQSRAEEFNITGVTYALTQGVVKNIIPAIASTNAIIAASCCNEALKMITDCNPYMDNYMQYSGDDGIYTYTFNYAKKDDCPVCGNETREIRTDPRLTLGEFITSLAERAESQLKKPSIRKDGKSLYMQSPPSLEVMTRSNLERKVAELIEDGEQITVTDPAFNTSFNYVIKYTS